MNDHFVLTFKEFSVELSLEFLLRSQPICLAFPSSTSESEELALIKANSVESVRALLSPEIHAWHWAVLRAFRTKQWTESGE